MSTALAIAGRELRDKTRIFAAAAILALVPFAAALLPSARAWGRPMVIALAGGLLSIAFALGMAVVLGATAIGRELSDRRLSFYFAKPVSPASIWIGKALASIATTLVVWAIVAVPALLVTRATWNATWMLTQGELVRDVVIAVVVLFLVSHYLSTIIRSRSALLAVDVALLAGTAFALMLLARPLLLGSAIGLLRNLMVAVAVAVTLVLALVPIVQLAQGRTDVRRNHLALSRAFWPAVAVVLLLAAGFVGWVVSAGPSDLHKMYPLTTGSRWYLVAGEAKNRADYSVAFLVDSQTGDWKRLSLSPYTGVTFSRDGRSVAWSAPTGLRPNDPREIELMVWNPDTEAKPRATGLRVALWTNVLSHDGKRIASVENGVISVHDLERGALLASARGLREVVAHEMMFVRPDLVRIWQHDEGRGGIDIFELDVTRKTMTKTGRVEGRITPFQALSANADGSRLLLTHSGMVIDGRTGAELFRLPQPQRPRMTSMLSDGTVVVPERGRLRIYAPDGRPTADLALPNATSAYVCAELAGGKVVVTSHRDKGGVAALIVDARRGVIERRYEGLAVPPMPWNAADPRTPLVAEGVGLPAAIGDRNVVWDWKTDERKPIKG